jgi:hypothetical protein
MKYVQTKRNGNGQGGENGVPPRPQGGGEAAAIDGRSH